MIGGAAVGSELHRRVPESLREIAPAPHRDLAALERDRIRWPLGQALAGERLERVPAARRPAGQLGQQADVSLLSELASGSAGCWHPLQSFTGEGLAEGPPYAVALQGSEVAVRRGRDLAQRLGHPAVELAADGRAAYHAAAVLASNCLVALQATAVRVMGSAGVSDEEAWQLLWPLVHGTLQNLRGGPVVGSLTGPIARGDAETVERNLGALQGDPGARCVYEALGMEAVALMQGGSPSPDDEQRLERIRQILACAPPQT